MTRQTEHRAEFRLPGTFPFFVLCAAVFLFSVAGCGRSGASPDPTAGFIRFGIKQNPTTLDPALIVDVGGGRVAAKLFNGLVRYGKDLGLVPDLAESWTLSPDGRVYTFTLRSGARFSNGRPVTAEDFRYSFERVLSPETHSPRRWVFERVLGARAFSEGRAPRVEGFDVRDGRTFVITLEAPFSPFLSLLGTPAAYVVPREEVERLGRDFSFAPVGTGPFRLERWLPDQRLDLVRNAAYFDGPAAAPGLVFRVLPEDFSMRTEFEAKNLDVIPVTRALLPVFRQHRLYRSCLTQTASLNTYYVGFNCRKPPFDSAPLRRALNESFSREKIIRAILASTAAPAVGPVPPKLLPLSAPAPVWRDDPERARAVVFPLCGDRVFDFFITTDEEALSVAQVLQHYFAKAGLRTRLCMREWSSFKAAIDSGQADLFLMSWWADYPSAENFLYPTFHSVNAGPNGNRVHLRDPGLDALIESAQTTLDPGAASALYLKAEACVRDLSPWVFLWHKNEYAVFQPEIRGFELDPIYNMDKGTGISRAD